MVCDCQKTTKDPRIHIPGCPFKTNGLKVFSSCCCHEMTGSHTTHKQGCPISQNCSSCHYPKFICNMMGSCGWGRKHVPHMTNAAIVQRVKALGIVYDQTLKPHIIGRLKNGGISKERNAKLVALKDEFKKLLAKQDPSTDDLNHAETLLIKIRVGSRN